MAAYNDNNQEINGVTITSIVFREKGGVTHTGNYPDEVLFQCELSHKYFWNSNASGGVDVFLVSSDASKEIRLTTSANDWDLNYSSTTNMENDKKTKVQFTVTNIRQTLYNYLLNNSTSNFNTSTNRNTYLNFLKNQPEFTKVKIKFYLKNNSGYTIVGTYTMTLNAWKVENNKLTLSYTKKIIFPKTNSEVPTAEIPNIKSATTNKNVYYRKNGTNYYNNNCLVGKLETNSKTITWHQTPIITLNNVSIYTNLRTPTKERLIPIDRLVLRTKINDGYFDIVINLDDLATSNSITLSSANSYNGTISTTNLGPGFLTTKFSAALKDMNNKIGNYSAQKESVPFICSNGEIEVHVPNLNFPLKEVILYKDHNIGNDLSFTWDRANGDTNDFVSYYYNIFYCDNSGTNGAYQETLLFRRLGIVQDDGTSNTPDGTSDYPLITPNGTNGFTLTYSRDSIAALISKHFTSKTGLIKGWFKIQRSLNPTFDSNKDSNKLVGDNNGFTLNSVRTKLYDSPILKVKKKELFYDSSNQKCRIENKIKTYRFSDQNSGQRKDIYINSNDEYYINQLTFQHLLDVKYTKISVTIKDCYWDKTNGSVSDKTSSTTNFTSDALKQINSNTELYNEYPVFYIGPNLTAAANTYSQSIDYDNVFYHHPSNYSHLNYRKVIIDVSYEVDGKTYTETNTHIYDQNRLNIFFCNVNSGNFRTKGEILNFEDRSNNYTDIVVNFTNLFEDLGGCQSSHALSSGSIKNDKNKVIDGPYAYYHQNFYNNGDFDSGSTKIIKRRISFKYNNLPLTAVIETDTGAIPTTEPIETDIIDFSENLESNLLFSSEQAKRTETISYRLTNNGEKIFGVVEVTVDYILLEGAYYTNTTTSRDPLVVSGYTLTFNTAQPTIYKRPFSVGINQHPGDQEVLRIDLPTDVNKKYLALGDKLLIDLTTGTFYTWASDTTTTPSSTTVYINMLIPKGESDFTNAIPYREAIWKKDQSLPSEQRKYKKGYRTYTKKTSF